MIRRLILALALFAASASGQQGHPPVMLGASTENAEKLDPTLPWISEYKAPPIYYSWIQELAQCEGLPFNLDRVKKIQWFQVNGPDFIPFGVPYVVYGITYAEAFDGQTYVAYSLIWNRQLVKHEALHSLLKMAGVPTWNEHDPRYFERCGIKTYGPPDPN